MTNMPTLKDSELRFRRLFEACFVSWGCVEYRLSVGERLFARSSTGTTNHFHEVPQRGPLLTGTSPSL